MVKEGLEQRTGPGWHVIVGPGFGFEISYELKNILYMPCQYLFTVPASISGTCDLYMPMSFRRAFYTVRFSDISPYMLIRLLFLESLQLAAKMLKDALEEKMGAGWHVVVGQGFGYEVNYDKRFIMFMYFGGNTAILMWKCL
nr:unnamed protein product [Spirometra erinaceieuropaei]